MGAQGDSKSWHELPFWTLVKNYLKCFVLGFGSCYILIRFLNFDLQLLYLHIQYPWLILPEGFTLVGGLWLWNWSRTSERKKRQKQAQQQLAQLLKEARGGEKQK